MSPRIRRPFLALVTAALCIGLAGAQASPGKSTGTLMTGPSPFDGDPCLDAVEPPYASGAEVDGTLAVDPTDRRRLVAAFIQDDQAGTGIATSQDAGRTWEHRALPGLTNCSGNDRWGGAFDPWVSIGGDGRIYVVSALGGDAFPAGTDLRDPLGYGIGFNTSVDGGRTFSEARIVVEQREVFIVDKPHVVADPEIPGTAYLTWTGIQFPSTSLTFLSRTVDGGTSWSTPSIVAVPPPGKGEFGTQTLVLPDGSLLNIASEISIQPGFPVRAWFGATDVVASRSVDGGLTWSDRVLIAEVPENRPTDPETGEARERGIPFVVVSSASDASGRVYVAWNHVDPSGSSRRHRTEDTGGRTRGRSSTRPGRWMRHS
jgi:hypothetical protein